MTTTLFQLLLITGVASFALSAPLRYSLIQEMKTWYEAQAYCQAKHIDLAIIKSSDDMAQFQDVAQNQNFTSEAWIGLYNDINSWHWAFDNQPAGMNLWASGEPNNAGGHEECGVASHSGWADVGCTTIWNSVCFDNRSGVTDRFIHVYSFMTWYDARNYCRQRYTDLAVVKDDADNRALQSFLPDWSWVGLVRDAWKWIDKTNMSNINWGPGKPDNAQGQENCGFVSNGQASDAQCLDKRIFFCYSEITGIKQTLKLKIMSDGDLNDPAVKAAMLEKIKKQLTVHGVAENTTVKWIEKPGGAVFLKEKQDNNDVFDNTTKQSCDL